MVKAIGILLAFCGCTAAGLLKASALSQRRSLLYDFKDLLLHISTEISYLKEPLPQIFQRLSGAFYAGNPASGEGENEEALKETGLLLRSWLTAYQTGNGNLEFFWNQAVDGVYSGLPVTEEDLNLMKKCGDFLGQSDWKGQREHFLLLNTRLDRQIAGAEEQIRTKGRMYSRMGVSVGMIIAVMFV